jgi:Icc-related predicted phosphoesterase
MADGQTRIFFAADIHGSQVTFRKFLAAATFYGVDALVFGGDLMGKALVPILRTNGGFHASFQGRDEEFDADGLAQFTDALEQPGFYWKVFERDEYEAVEGDPMAKHGLFHELASERLAGWIDRAEEALRGTRVRLYLTGGNDDEPSVLATLERHDGGHVIASEGRLVELDGEHTMITVGLSTFTPWDTPREASEEEIARTIEAAVATVPDVGRCVFNLHCPPKDTPIDTCLKLEVRPGELPRPIREGGRFLTTGGGSTAVREAIERYQPVLSLHGHIHESRGNTRIGKTLCINPGSSYEQGELLGAVIDLDGGKKVKNFVLTSG